MALVQLPTVEESITALVKLHNFQLSETSHLRFFPPSLCPVMFNNFFFQGLLLQKHNLEGRGIMKTWTLEPFVPSLKIIGSFCHLKVLQYWFHAVCCIGRGYLHKFIFGTHGFFFYPETYICLVPTCFQAPQRYIEKLDELLKYFWIHSCQPHWRQELLSNQLENLRYNQVEEDSDDYVVCIISLYFPPPMTANCLVHGEQQLSPLYLQTFMSIYLAFCFSLSYSVAVLYITCY